MLRDREKWLTPGNIIAIISVIVAIALSLLAGWQAHRIAVNTGQFSGPRGHLLVYGEEPPAEVDEIDVVFSVPDESGALAIGYLYLGVANSGERMMKNAHLVIRSGTTSRLALPAEYVNARIQGALRDRRVERTVQESEVFTYVDHALGDIYPETAVTLAEPIPLVATTLTASASSNDTFWQIAAHYSHNVRVTLVYDDTAPVDLDLAVSAIPIQADGKLEVEYLRRVYLQRENAIRSLGWGRRMLARLSSPDPVAILLRPTWERVTSASVYLGEEPMGGSWLGWD